MTKTYSQTGLCETCGTVWNLSCTGWRFSGNLPLRIGEVCSLTVNLPSHQPIYVAAGMVRCVRGEEFGVETLVTDDESREELEDYLWQRLEESADNIPRTTCALDANACRSTRGPCLARERPPHWAHDVCSSRRRSPQQDPVAVDNHWVSSRVRCGMPSAAVRAAQISKVNRHT